MREVWRWGGGGGGGEWGAFRLLLPVSLCQIPSESGVRCFVPPASVSAALSGR